MRILLVHDYAPAIGGAEIVNDVLVRGLRARGHEVRQLTSTAGADESALATSDYTCRGTTGRWRTVLQSANPWAPSALRAALREFRPDVVHVRIYQTQLSPLILPVLRGYPSIYHEVWNRAACPTGNKLLPDGRSCAYPAGLSCLTQRCLPVHDWGPLMAQRFLVDRWRDVFCATIANSAATADVLARDGAQHIVTIPDGVPTTSAPSTRSGAPAVAYVGRLVREKGVAVLLRAFAALPATHDIVTMDVVGEGSERSSLEALAARLGIARRVRFHGYQSRERCGEIAGTAWVQAVPSLSEAFGLVAAEAMMRGTAVIASACGGLRELVRHNVTGLLVPPGDVEGLTHALARVFHSEQLAAQWGAEGRRVAMAEYSIDRFIDRVLAVYDAVAHSPRGSAPPAEVVRIPS